MNGTNRKDRIMGPTAQTQTAQPTSDGAHPTSRTGTGTNVEWTVWNARGNYPLISVGNREERAA